MAALITDERCCIIASFIIFLLMKTEQAKSGTSAATYNVMEPHLATRISRSRHQVSEFAF